MQWRRLEIVMVTVREEAQLSLRGCMTIHVVGNFAKSLKITQGNSKLLFLRYLTSNNGMYFNQSGLGVIYGII